jgi:2-amino-4-hydroxy-6-hydroxymethyldihydropteridine diphosphokinase
MNRVYIALGSNINKEENLPLAVRLLDQMCQITAVSSVYETAPVGLLDQPNFLNAAVCIDTELSAAQLKVEVLSVIEAELKREREVDKNAPRTIDADIVLYNDDVFEYEHVDGRSRLIPDPDLLKFLHIAVPMAELAPDLRHPQTDETLAAIARRLRAAATSDGGRIPLWKRPDFTTKVKGLLE